MKVEGEYFSHQNFCDDVVIYGTYKRKKIIQKMLTYMTKKMNNFGFELNLTKSSIDYVQQYNSKKLSPPPQFTILGNIISQTRDSYKYLGQNIQIGEVVWEKKANEIKETLNLIYKLYNSDLKFISKKDYWYAYQVMWKNKINWFIRVNILKDNSTEDEVRGIKLIEKVEKEWFKKVGVDKLKEEDYINRRENAIMSRFSALSNSLDKRIVQLYKKIMGDSYTILEEKVKNKTVNLKTGFKCDYYDY